MAANGKTEIVRRRLAVLSRVEGRREGQSRRPRIVNLVGGECAGTILQTEDGKTQQVGYCARHDKDGGTQSISFHQAPGADKGEWKSTGGTGQFAGKAGSVRRILIARRRCLHLTRVRPDIRCRV
jgi:hypothetical protein